MLLSATRSNNISAVLSAHCMQRHSVRRRPGGEREYCKEKRPRSDLMGRLLAGAAGFAFGAAASGGLHAQEPWGCLQACCSTYSCNCCHAAPLLPLPWSICIHAENAIKNNTRVRTRGRMFPCRQMITLLPTLPRRNLISFYKSFPASFALSFRSIEM